MKTLFVTIEEFLVNGGKLELGRTIYREERRHFDSEKFKKEEMLNHVLYMGEYIGFDDEQKVYLVKE